MEKATSDGEAVVAKPGNIVANLLRSKLDDFDPDLGPCADETEESGLLICYEPTEELSEDCQMALSFDLLENFFNSYPDLLSEMTTWVKDRQKPKVYKTYLRKCRICQRAFTNQKDLDEHKQIHFEMDRSFRCKTCRKLFFDIRNLKNHEKVHIREKSKCQICLKEFRHEKYLNQHMKRHHDNSPPSEETEGCIDIDSNSSEDENEPTYSCEHCGKHFSTESKLTTHNKIHVSHKSFKCGICPKAFSKEKNLISHLSHHDICSFPCKLCGKVLKTRTKLDAHMNIHYSH